MNTKAYIILIEWDNESVVWNTNKNGGQNNSSRFVGYLDYQSAKKALPQVKRSFFVRSQGGVPRIVEVELPFKVGETND